MKFHLLVIDELFSSTNPNEAISASYSICKHLSTYTNSIKFVTTHYDYLTKLNKWSNYYFQANIINNQIIYDYKLKKGKCNNHIALKILSKKIKDDTIIKDAIKNLQKAYLNNSLIESPLIKHFTTLKHKLLISKTSNLLHNFKCSS